MSEEWAYLSELPSEIDGFVLVRGKEGELFSYENVAMRRRAVFFYNDETKDYMLRCVFGLLFFNDARFIAKSREAFEAILREHLVKRVRDMGQGACGYVLEHSGILSWDYSSFLPEKVAGFERYISPDGPVSIINATDVIVDYSDFEMRAHFLIFYSELKNEFYAEKNIRGVIETTNRFDAKNIKALEERLAVLESYLSDFRQEIEKKFLSDNI